mgnify:CR=1 FL=1
MIPIVINHEQCIGCSLCVNDCPNACLYLKDGKAETKNEGCIECGHCFAVCPINAITMKNFPSLSEKVVSMEEIDHDVLLKAMRSRRSIRHFKSDEVEKEKIAEILEAGRYAPSGGNSQDVCFTLLGDRKKQAEEICVKLFRLGKKVASPFSSYLRQINIDDDFFFKKAPLVIVVSGKNKTNCDLSSAYMELMAESLGLGVLYSGFFVICTKLSRKLKKLLSLEKGNKVFTCMIIGYPSVKYQRIVPRKKARVKAL